MLGAGNRWRRLRRALEIGNKRVSLVGFAVSVTLGLYWLWRVILTPGEL